MGFVLAIDGGGTKTRAVICDANGEVARGESGSSNVTTVGVEKMKDAVVQAVEIALESLKIDRIDIFEVVWAGFAGLGASESALYEKTHTVLQDLFNLEADKIVLTTDGNLLAGQLSLNGMEYGIGLIAGTGSIAMAFHNKDLISRSGGWGSLLGDEGSGYYIGLEGLKKTMQVNDEIERAKVSGAPLPQLANWQRQILVQLGVEEGGNLHIRVLQAIESSAIASKVLISSFSRNVFGASGDPEATAIIDNAAYHLARMVLRLTTVIDPESSVLILGGSINGVSGFKSRIEKHLKTAGVTFKKIDLVEDPALAASMAIASEYLT